MILFHYFEKFLKLQEGLQRSKMDEKEILEKLNRLFRKTNFIPIKAIQMLKLR